MRMVKPAHIHGFDGFHLSSNQKKKKKKKGTIGDEEQRYVCEKVKGGYDDDAMRRKPAHQDRLSGPTRHDDG